MGCGVSSTLSADPTLIVPGARAVGDDIPVELVENRSSGGQGHSQISADGGCSGPEVGGAGAGVPQGLTHYSSGEASRCGFFEEVQAGETSQPTNGEVTCNSEESGDTLEVESHRQNIHRDAEISLTTSLSVKDHFALKSTSKGVQERDEGNLSRTLLMQNYETAGLGAVERQVASGCSSQKDSPVSNTSSCHQLSAVPGGVAAQPSSVPVQAPTGLQGHGLGLGAECVIVGYSLAKSHAIQQLQYQLGFIANITVKQKNN